jgi:hypothetical protein
MATFNKSTGVILDDIWEESVLTMFQPDLIQTGVHYPVIGVE